MMLKYDMCRSGGVVGLDTVSSLFVVIDGNIVNVGLIVYYCCHS